MLLFIGRNAMVFFGLALQRSSWAACGPWTKMSLTPLG